MTHDADQERLTQQRSLLSSRQAAALAAAERKRRGNESLMKPAVGKVNGGRVSTPKYRARLHVEPPIATPISQGGKGRPTGLRVAKVDPERLLRYFERTGMNDPDRIQRRTRGYSPPIESLRSEWKSEANQGKANQGKRG